MTSHSQNIVLEDGEHTVSSGNAVASLINDSIASFNESFHLPRITQNDESFQSPNIHSPAPHNMADLGLNANAYNIIHNRILQDLQATFRGEAVNFFHQIENRLESIVDMKVNSTTYKESLARNIAAPATTTANQTHVLEEKLTKFDEAYEDFISFPF